MKPTLARVQGATNRNRLPDQRADHRSDSGNIRICLIRARFDARNNPASVSP